MLRNTCCFLYCLLLLAACKTSSVPESGKGTELVVLSYNIHHGNPPTQTAGLIDLDTIAATIRASGADLVAVQELDSVTTRSNGVDQLKVLAEKLQMFYRYERTIPYGGGAYGIGILSRYAFVETRRFPLPDIDGIKTEPRILMMAKIEKNGKPLYFGCTHLDYQNKEVKLAQAKELQKLLASFSDTPVIVAGDFNATPNEEGIQLISAQYASAGKPTDFTIPVLKPAKKIDYIFYDKRLTLVQDSVLTQHSYGSDHLPIKASFKF